MSATAVCIDSREPTWVQALDFGVPSTVTLLDYGDIWVTTADGQVLAIERKTAGDLLNTLREDRLWTQLAGLRGVSPWAYLLITGTLLRNPLDGMVVLDHAVAGWSWAAVQGALLSAQELGVFVAWAANDEDLAPAVLRLANRRRDAAMIIPPARAARVLTPGEAALAALPGIGLEKTIALLDHYQTPAHALAAMTQMWTGASAVPGIGDGTKAKVRQALQLEDWAELAVLPRPNYKPPENGGETNV